MKFLEYNRFGLYLMISAIMITCGIGSDKINIHQNIIEETGIIDTSLSNKIEVNSIEDIEGNTYKIVQIGDQTWMAENLRTTKYNDGEMIDTSINDLPEEGHLLDMSTVGYCWYNFDIKNKEIHGALYNWNTVNSGKLCPSGWHVPTDGDWKELCNYVKQHSENYHEPDQSTLYQENCLANEFGLSLTPSGRRTGFHEKIQSETRGLTEFNGIGKYYYLWSCTPVSETSKKAIFYWGQLDEYLIRDLTLKECGCSVRCLKD